MAKYEWLRKAIRDGAWWQMEDGHVQMHLTVPDFAAAREGLIAFAEALDMTVDERPVGAPEPSLPDRPPVRFDDLSRTP